MALGVAIAGLVVAVVGTAYSISSGEEQKRATRRASRKRAEQLKRQAAIDTAQAQRAGRIRSAQLAAQGAGTVGGSALEGAVVSTQTAVSNQAEFISQGLSAQQSALSLDTRNRIDAIDNQITSDVLDISSTVLAQTRKDIDDGVFDPLFSNETPVKAETNTDG